MGNVMEYLHNYFYKFKERGNFAINFNTISIDGCYDLQGKYVVGQYIRIKGSLVNDGVYKVIAVSEDGLPGITVDGCLSDEEFEGYICSLAVPKAFISLCNDIKEYEVKNPPKEFISESFGGYSYTRSQASVESGLSGWQLAFKGQLAPYRRMSDGFIWVKEVSNV